MALKEITRVLYRSAVTGKFVTKSYAASHPDTTVTERVKVLVHHND